MISLIVSLFLLGTVPRALEACNTTNTWLVAEFLNDTATYPPDFRNDTFCTSTKDLTNAIAFYTDTKLADANEQMQFEQLSQESFVTLNSNCQQSGQFHSVQACISHCPDKHIELLAIRSSIQSSDPATVTREIYSNLTGSVVISAFFDLSTTGQMVSYDYFQDPAFCSVFVKIKNFGMFPYAIFTTVSKVFK